MIDKYTSCVLVTGGCGFIGSHFVEELHRRHPEYFIVVVDDLRTPAQHVVRNKGLKYYFKSIQDEQLLTDLTHQYEFSHIFHLANTPRVRRAIEFPREAIDNNVTSTTAVCDLALHHGATLFFAQSSSIKYKEAITNAYTLSKVFADGVLKMYGTEYGLHAINMYFYSVFGPREADYGAYSTVVRRFKQKVLADESLEIYGNGTKERDFTYVGDVVRNMVDLMHDKNLDKYNAAHFGRGSPKTIQQIADAFRHEMVYRFDLPGEAQRTFCEQPYGEYKTEVLDYIKQWRDNVVHSQSS